MEFIYSFYQPIFPPAWVKAFFPWALQSPNVGAFSDSASHFLTPSALWFQVKLGSSTFLTPFQTLPVVSPSVLFASLDPWCPGLSLPSCPWAIWVEKHSSGVWFTLKSSLSLASNGHSMLPSRPFIFLPWPQFPKKTISCLLPWKLLYSFLHSQMMASHFMDKIEKLSSLQQTCNLHQGSSSPPWLG